MEPIDNAASTFKQLCVEIAKYENTIFTEQDSRVKIIDRLFTEVLGWSYSDFNTEEKAGDGYLDYIFSVDRLSRLIVEAKRDGLEFDLKKNIAGRAFKLNGPVFNEKPLNKGIEQAIRYCAYKSCELSCVTNGKQWVIFRGSRLGDGKNTLDGMAFFFSSLKAVEKSFKIFYNLLSYNSVSNNEYRAYFADAEGQPIRSINFKKSIRHPDSKQLLPASSLSHDIEKVMNSFFRIISVDDESDMLLKCFVTTRESKLADQKLARISEDIVNRIRIIETDEGKILADIITNVKDSKRNEFVVLVVTKGAGKSTFIDRFFHFILAKEISKECILIKINLANSDGDYNNIPKWLNEHLLVEAEKALFTDGTPNYEELQGMFFDEYSRWMKGTYKYLYKKDKDKFKIEFGKHIELRRENRPHEYIQRLISSIVNIRKKLPCLIFDNADHYSIEFQEAVFQYARSIYEKTICLIITPVTDKTSWQLSRQGAMQSFDNETLYLPTPSPKQVIEKRIEYLNEKLLDEKKRSGHGYFFNKGIQLSLQNLNAFAATLQSIFLSSGYISQQIGKFANLDIRASLDIARHIMVSPYLSIDELFKTYMSGGLLDMDEKNIKKAIIRGKYDIYPSGQHKYLQNIFCINNEIETSPLICLRILQLLIDAGHIDPDGKSTYITIDNLISYMRVMGFEQRCVTLCLQAMLLTGLCFSYDPTKTKISEIKSIEISPSGLQHYHWGKQDFTYIYSMTFVTPIYNRNIFDEMTSLNKSESKRYAPKISKLFITYIIDEDSKYCIPQTHPSYKGQNEIILAMNRFIESLQ